MSARPVGLLLAAGRGTRYDASGARLKLLEAAPAGPRAGMALALAAAAPLLEVLDEVVAVVRPVEEPHQRTLHSLLSDAGCRLLVCDRADEGMGASLACGVAGSASASGWLVALADMPSIASDTVRRLCAALQAGAASAAPWHRGRRGHPVGFSACCGPDLRALAGDAGARAVLARFPPARIDVDDAGTVHDIDTADA